MEHARASLSLVETEETWDTICNSLLRIIALSKGGACDFPTVLTSSIRSMHRPIISAAASERSRLSATAVECIGVLATGLGPSFDPLVPLFVPTLLSICSRPNKVFISRAKATIQTIIDQTQLISLLPYFFRALREKSITLRLIAIESLLACVQCFNPPDLERDARAREIEGAIRLTATDASADVRKVSRHVFDAYKILLPARVESFAAPLSPTMKKYLNIDIAGNSRPQSSQSTYALPAIRPTSSQAPAPSKWEETRPRPATSMARHRSASSSAPAPTMSSSVMASKRTRSKADPKTAPTIGHSAAGPPSKNRNNMPPPAIVPQRRQQPQSEPQAIMEHPVGTGNPHLKVAARPQEVCSSKTATQILRPESTQTLAPPPKQYAGPLRAGALTVKERLLGGPQRVLLPEAQRPPEPPKPLLTSQETKVSAEVEVVFRRSRLDSVRHGPKSSAVMDAKRAVSQVAVTTSAVPKRPGLGPPQPPTLVVEKGAPIEATEKKKDTSKPRFDAKNTKVNSKIPNSGAVRKRDPQMSVSAFDRPKSSVSTRSIGEGGTEAKTRKKNESEGAPPGGAEIPTHPPKVAVRTGGATQPTLSQLARMKAAGEEKERRAVAKGSTKPLTIRPRHRAVPPKATSKKVDIPTAAITTPLPPSPEVRPADVPLPASPVPAQDDQMALPSLDNTQSNAVAAANEHSPVPTPTQVHPVQNFGAVTVAAKTPISALVSSIQRGFLLSPNSPLSPAQPDAEWECPAWPGLVLDVGEGPSFEGVAESTVKRPPAVLRGDTERKALVDINYSS